ncbi:Hypothetical_protein [Hexamita inflata]|uniref:Hypothetical_protein n=1 Tax=Hexamita inflata TaxID=28002 RepID=A0AA86TV61_9EUKA|nr:Hypothetical protein HINF_LOCUS17534 [Hexamita inflata]
MKRYSTKSYAYKRFVDVILPELLPPYPKQIQIDIENFITQRIQLETSINSKSETEFRKELEKEVKTRFKLKGTDPHQFKKQVDRNRYLIQKLIIQKNIDVLHNK